MTAHDIPNAIPTSHRDHHIIQNVQLFTWALVVLISLKHTPLLDWPPSVIGSVIVFMSKKKKKKKI